MLTSPIGSLPTPDFQQQDIWQQEALLVAARAYRESRCETLAGRVQDMMDAVEAAMNPEALLEAYHAS